MQAFALELGAVTFGATASMPTDVDRLGHNDGTVDGCLKETPWMAGTAGSAPSVCSATAHDETFYMTMFSSIAWTNINKQSMRYLLSVVYQTTCLRPSEAGADLPTID